MIRSLLIFLLILINCISSQNKNPIVFVHGFMGWGEEEMGPYKYWGGWFDLVGELEKEGYTIFVASVGPVSSSWDRAIELYYQIKGGQIDYGKYHSEKYGLIQKPLEKDYKGLYPQWSEKNPLHFIGHSMGGQTIRMLDYLLNNVLQDSLGTIEKSKLLGKTNKGWIKSITTLSTPHNGTTISDFVNVGIPFLQNFIALAGVAGNSFYNFDLEQWGFKRFNEESWINYFKRMKQHSIWDSKNTVAWDSSIEGAKEINSLCVANPDVYYFSIANYKTKIDKDSGYHKPMKAMSNIIKVQARLMGRKKAYYSDGTSTDSTWYLNDGVVNTVSMYGPTTGSSGPDPVTEFRQGDVVIPGQWYVMGNYEFDHSALIGHQMRKDEYPSLKKIYSDQLKILWSLPN